MGHLLGCGWGLYRRALCTCMSHAVHDLLSSLEDAQLQAYGLARGRDGTKHERSDQKHGSFQDILLLPDGLCVQGGGGAQAGRQEEGMGQDEAR